jgi:hypothetical protein
LSASYNQVAIAHAVIARPGVPDIERVEPINHRAIVGDLGWLLQFSELHDESFAVHAILSVISSMSTASSIIFPFTPFS